MLWKLLTFGWLERWRREAPQMFDGRLAWAEIDACMVKDGRR